MAAGNLNLKIAVNNKKAFNDLKNFENKVKQTGNQIKSYFIALNVGKFLLSGADGYIDEFMAKARAKMNFKDLGFSENLSEQIFEITNEFEKLGYSADTANDAVLNFVSSGKATALRNLGIYLDKNTQQVLSNVSANERLNWVLENGKDKLAELKDSMPENVRALTEMKKNTDDLKKSLGASFLTVLNSIIKGFGGVNNSMKVALIGFAAYKTATIIGNVAIGISKALAQGGIFAAPIAFAMGATALTSLLAMGIGTGIAANSLNKNADDSIGSQKNITEIPASTTPVNISINEDPYGKEVYVSSGGKRTKAETSYGSSD